MTENILVPIDGSEQSERALDYALESFPDASITLLNVFTRGPPEAHLERRGKDYDELRARRRELLDQLVEEGTFDGDIETEVVVGRPSREIVAYAEDHEIDQIVMGSHGRDGAFGSSWEASRRRSSAVGRSR